MKTIIVAGYGPGISRAVAEKFGKEGFAVAIVSRNTDKLATGVRELEESGVKAAGFKTDLSDPAAVKTLVANVRAKLGPISVVHWNAYGGAAGDLLKADQKAIHNEFDVAVTGLVTAVQESLPDMKGNKEAAVLVTNGGFGLLDPKVDAMAVEYNAMGLAMANAVKNKLVGLLSEKLKNDGVYVGQVVVMGSVKGTPFDGGNATLEGSAVAEKFWAMYQARNETSTNIG